MNELSFGIPWGPPSALDCPTKGISGGYDVSRLFTSWNMSWMSHIKAICSWWKLHRTPVRLFVRFGPWSSCWFRDRPSHRALQSNMTVSSYDTLHDVGCTTLVCSLTMSPQWGLFLHKHWIWYPAWSCSNPFWTGHHITVFSASKGDLRPISYYLAAPSFHFIEAVASQSDRRPIGGYLICPLRTVHRNLRSLMERGLSSLQLVVHWSQR